MPPEIQGKLKQFRRLVLSTGDFKNAKLAAEYILLNELHRRYPDESYVTLPALNCSMILAYTRPFSGNIGNGPNDAPDLPVRFLNLLTAEERGVHETVLFDRNKFLAHSDAEALQVEPVRLQVAESQELLIPIVNWGMAPLKEEPTRLLLSAATKLHEASLMRRLEMEHELFPYFRAATPETFFKP